MLVGVIEAGALHLNDPVLDIPSMCTIFAHISLADLTTTQRTPGSETQRMIGSSSPPLKSMLVAETYHFRGAFPLSHLNLHSMISLMGRGKLLGGSSGINGMAWDRGAAAEYDAWGHLAGDTDWRWSQLLPFMKKSETFVKEPTDPYPGISAEEAARVEADLSQVDGFDGPIMVCSLS